MRWQFGAVQFSEWDADGFLGVQLDPVQGRDTPGAAKLFEVQHPYGFFSRPRDPDSDGLGCSVSVAKRGDREGYAWLGSDPRTLEKIPNGSKGTTGIFAHTDDNELSFYEIDGETGTHSAYVPDGSSAHFVQIGVDDGGASVVKLQHSEGMAVVMFDGKAIIHSSGGGVWLQIDDDGILANGNLKNYGGFECGGDGSLPLVLHTPLATAVSAYVTTASAAMAAFATGTATATDPKVTAAVAAFSTAMTSALVQLSFAVGGTTGAVLAKGK